MATEEEKDTFAEQSARCHEASLALVKCGPAQLLEVARLLDDQAVTAELWLVNPPANTITKRAAATYLRSLALVIQSGERITGKKAGGE